MVFLQPPSKLIGKVWVPVMHYHSCPIHCRVHWRVAEGKEHDRVNHQGILYQLCSVSIGGSVLSILTQFLSNRSPEVMVDGCRSKLVNVVSGVQQ